MNKFHSIIIQTTSFLNNFVKKYKIPIMVVFIIFTIFLSVVFFTYRNTKRDVSNIPTLPTPSPVLIYPTPSASYFINQLTNSLPPVNSVSWIGDKLYYSNNAGIYDASTNKVVKKDSVVNPSWSENGKVVYHNGKTWKGFDAMSQKELVLPQDMFYPTISPNGLLLLDRKGSNIYIYELGGNTKKEKVLTSNISRCVWAKQSDMVIIQYQKGGENTVTIYNTNLEEQKSYTLGGLYDLISISPDAKHLLTSKEGSLNIIDEDAENKPLYNNRGSVYSISWIDEFSFVAIETKFDKNGKQTDYFWKHNINKKPEYLTNSMPVTGKINVNVPMLINLKKEVFALTENGGKIWLLSLVPGKMAFYSNDGISFFEMSTKHAM